MDIELITDIAKDRIISDLCMKWYLEIDDEKKKIIFDEIQIIQRRLYPNNNI
tara:strand:+ start:631 stop:786 length:156 start_codon:yes stop_codon:yes gene_type:complete